MPSLTLKDIPPKLLTRLRSAAARERRSLNQEVILLVERGLAERETAEERAARQVAAWRDLAGSWKSSEPFAAEVGALYDARTVSDDEP